MQGCGGFVEFADTKLMIAKQKLEISILQVLVCRRAEGVDLLDEVVIGGIEAARIKDAFCFRIDLSQSLTKRFCGLGVISCGKQGLRIGKGQNFILGCELPCEGKFLRGGVVIAIAERLYAFIEVIVGRSCGGRRFGLLLGIGEVGLVDRLIVIATCGRLARAAVVVIVSVIVVSVAAARLIRDRVVAIPVIRGAAIPVIAHIIVIIRPVSAGVDEEVSAMIIRIDGAE